jgi:hypothetical protein
MECEKAPIEARLIYGSRCEFSHVITCKLRHAPSSKERWAFLREYWEGVAIRSL